MTVVLRSDDMRRRNRLRIIQIVRRKGAVSRGEIAQSAALSAATVSTISSDLIAEGIINAVKEAVTIPVIASSGAGRVEHFSEVFEATDVEAALAAGIFHRREVPIAAVKDHLKHEGIEIRG